MMPTAKCLYFLGCLLLQERSPSLDDLILHLAHDDLQVRDRATRALLEKWESWSGADLKRLEEASLRGEAEARSRSKAIHDQIKALRSIGKKCLEAIPDLREGLKNESEEGRLQLIVLVAQHIQQNKVREEDVGGFVEVVKAWKLSGPLIRTQSGNVDWMDRVANYYIASFGKLFLPYLHDPQPEARVAAAWALRRLGATDPISNLESLLQDRIPSVRLAAVGALLELGGRKYLSEAIPLLKDPDTRTRASALGLIHGFSKKDSAKEYAPHVARLLNDPDREIRENAISCLGHLKAKKYAGEVSRFLKDPDRETRRSAAACLGALESKEFVKDLVLLLKDDYSGVRACAAHALGKMNMKEYAKDIVPLMKDAEWDLVRTCAIKALVALEAKEYVQEVVSCLQDKNENVRTEALRALESFQAKDRIQEIMALIQDEDFYVKNTAISVVARLSSSELSTLLKSKDNRTRAIAISTIGNLGLKDYAKDLSAFLEDPDTRVRSGAVQVLGRFRSKEFIPRIERLKKDPDKGIRFAAHTALLRMQDSDQRHAELSDILWIFDESNPGGDSAYHGLVEILVEILDPSLSRRLHEEFQLDENLSTKEDWRDVFAKQRLSLGWRQLGQTVTSWSVGDSGIRTSLYDLLRCCNSHCVLIEPEKITICGSKEWARFWKDKVTRKIVELRK